MISELATTLSVLGKYYFYAIAHKIVFLKKRDFFLFIFFQIHITLDIQPNINLFYQSMITK